MSTAHLPPERRAEIARNAVAARKNWSNQGRKPKCACGTCPRCKRLAVERRYRAKME